MDFPVAVALAKAVPVLPRGVGWWYEPKFDGDRAVLHRSAETVRIQARSGRDTTAVWMDIAVAGMQLPPGTVLDGEIVIWREQRLDFGAVRSRASSSPARARELAGRWPASYAVWDCLALGEDLRGLPYVDRRARLLDVLEGTGPPIQAVPATDEVDVAETWLRVLPEQGIEGVVAKRASSPYRAGRIWSKTRVSDTVDAEVLGYTGSPARPRALALRLPDGRKVLSQALPAKLAAQLAPLLRESGPGGRARIADGTPYLAVATGPVVEVLAGTTRHATVTVTRLR
ncbi:MULTISPECIES: DNA ligase [unclassified Streptomyces]|uniref:ATP-dependent DNA ligase n=1 Tax=unclassified Streptomyces TaxID=2593676 RepID=UPI00278C79DA|nr:MULTISPECIES: DNA ligase [unclassified Streptomyces]